MTTRTNKWHVILVSVSLIAVVILSGCATKNGVKNPPIAPVASATPSTSTSLQPVALAVPASCIETKVLAALKQTVPDAKFVSTEWTPSTGTELADVLNNSGIACSFGVQSAGVGLTAMWVKDTKRLYEARIAKWIQEGAKQVDIAQMDESSAYLLHKPQSTSQEFNIWRLNVLIHGFWIQLGLSYGDTLDSGLPLLRAAVDSLIPRKAKANIAGCYVGKLAKDRYVLSITEQIGINIKANIAYLNYQKDSSNGTFVGTYRDGILNGIYSFRSEGMDSRRELFYRQVNKGFIPGYGPIEMIGDEERMKRPLNLKWNSSFVFLPSTNCTIP